MNKEPIPGTHEPYFVEPLFKEIGIPAHMRMAWKASGMRGSRRWQMGDCTVLLSREPAGPERSYLWHLSISCLDRHPTWDEIKTARYRLLPLELTFAIMLVPPDEYVNVPEQDHVMHLWEIEDPRASHLIG